MLSMDPIKIKNKIFLCTTFCNTITQPGFVFHSLLRSYLTANKMVGETERWSCLKIRRDVFCLKCHNELNLLHSSWCGLCIINSPDSQSKSRDRAPLNWKIKKRSLNDTYVTLIFVCLWVSNFCRIKRKGIILVPAIGARIFHLLKCRKVLIVVTNKASF